MQMPAAAAVIMARTAIMAITTTMAIVIMAIVTTAITITTMAIAIAGITIVGITTIRTATVSVCGATITATIIGSATATGTDKSGATDECDDERLPRGSRSFRFYVTLCREMRRAVPLIPLCANAADRGHFLLAMNETPSWRD